MPNIDGKMYLSDFVVDLKRRGFDAIPADQLQIIVNQAYFAVANKSRWQWERTTVEFTVEPGDFAVDAACKPLSDLPNFRSLDKLYMTTAGYQRKMLVMTEDNFFQNYLSLDLSDQRHRSEPTHYFLYDDQLYILNPPQMARTFLAYYYQRPSWLISDLDPLVTPQHLDEAIIHASRVRAHTRVNEPSLAQLARADLEESFDDMRDDEEEDMREAQERVSPDDTWQ